MEKNTIAFIVAIMFVLIAVVLIDKLGKKIGDKTPIEFTVTASFAAGIGGYLATLALFKAIEFFW